MPRLPTAEDLGAPPSVANERGIATIDATPLARGAGALATGAQNLGNTLVSIGVQRAEKEQTQNDALQDAHANADLMIDLAQRKRAIGDASDPNGLEQAQREAAQARVNEIAAGIKDPAKAALFAERARTQVDALGGLAKARADELTKDADIAATNQKLSTLSKTASEDKDPASKEGYIRSGSALIDELAEKGHITQVDAQRRKEQFSRDYSYDAVNALPPQQRLATVRGGVEGAIIGRESSGNQRVVNPFGYAGLYQFGAPLLNTLGLYKPGAGEDLQGWSDSPANAPGKWSGSFNIPGFPGIRTLADFRESPEAQRAAFQASTAYYDKEIDRRGLGQFIGQTVNGVPITREGIYAGAHLGGIAGTDNWLRGGVDHNDANGSKISGYVRMGSAAGPGAGDPNERSIAKYLTPQQRLSVENGATREMMNQERAAQNAQANEAATVKSLIKDDEASILAQGAPLGSISPGRVSASLGPAAAEEFAQNRAQAVTFHDATADWSQIPLEQIRARLAGLRPAAGSKGYENADRLFSLAEKQATAIAKERSTDPAAAADRTPDVRAVLQGATLDKPETYQPVAKARAIAQDRLGIPEDLRSLATKDELRAMWRPVDTALKAGDEDKAHEALKSTLERITTAFGPENRKAVASQMLAEAGASKAAAAMSMDILDELSKGQLPTREQARAYDKAKAQETTRRNTQDWTSTLSPNVDPTFGATGTDYLNPQSAADVPPAYPTPTARAIEILRANPSPERIAAFNRPDRFGPGAAETVLKALGVPAGARSE